MRDKLILLSILIVTNVANAALQSDSIQNSTINKLHQRSLILLAKYNLNPTNKTPFYKEHKTNSPLPLERSFLLDTSDSNPHKNDNKLFFQQLQDVSVRIGLNPSLHLGKRLITLNYSLHDSSQGNTAITAHILFSDTILAGAYLSLGRYYGGIVALNNHSQFKPKNFIFPIFNPDLIDTVSILGPWDKRDYGCNWINRVNALSKEEISYLTKTFSTGKKVNADLHYQNNSPGEEYAADIKFKTGEGYFPHFIFRNDTVYLDDYKCYYILDRKFIDFVKEIIKSRGISICQETLQRRDEYRKRKNLKNLEAHPALGD